MIKGRNEYCHFQSVFLSRFDSSPVKKFLYCNGVKRVLVLGSSFSAVEMIKCIKNLSFHVIVCGREPSEPGHFIADESLFLDYSNVTQIVEYVKNNPVDFVLPTANDASYRTGLELAKILNFPGFDNPEEGICFLEKNHFRDLCDALDLSIPKFQVCTTKTLISCLTNFKVPFLIKPINSFSGKGILKIQNEEDRQNAETLFLNEDSEKTFVIENFLDGTLHSHSAFVREGQVVKDFFVDEFCVINDFAVDSSNHPSNIADEVKLQVRAMIDRILKNTNIIDGLVHTQFMISKNQVFLIESMRRCPGDLFPTLIKLSSGFDYIYNYIAPFLQLPPKDPTSLPNLQSPIARFTVASRTALRVFGIDVFSKCVRFSFYPLIRNGDHLKPFPEEKVGVLFVELSSTKELFSEVPHFQQKIGIID
jgi:formate-dependent phosphoribosylglycinamide formyltransferase (GAR transformylase)